MTNANLENGKRGGRTRGKITGTRDVGSKERDEGRNEERKKASEGGRERGEGGEGANRTSTF